MRDQELFRGVLRSTGESEGVQGHTGVSKGFLRSPGRSLGPLPRLQVSLWESKEVLRSPWPSKGVKGHPGMS